MRISKKRAKELKTLKDDDIDYSDIPELDKNFWKNAKIETPIKKQPISFRIDSDILEWFKNQGKGYQTKINTVLRSYAKAHSHSI